jgi:hypothetical protein
MTVIGRVELRSHCSGAPASEIPTTNVLSMAMTSYASASKRCSFGEAPRPKLDVLLLKLNGRFPSVAFMPP